jgi:hypothetical protein
MLEIFGKQTHMFNSYLTLMLQLVYVATSYCTSYLTKKDKIVKKKLVNKLLVVMKTNLKHILTFERWEMT